MIDNQKYSLQIWDTAGQERFRSISRVFFNDIKGIFIVFSLDNIDTLKHCEDWINDFYSVVDQSMNIPIVLVGNKLDLITNDGVVKIEDSFIKKFVGNNQIPLYFETSSKTNVGIEEAFKEMLQIIVKRKLNVANDDENEKFTLDDVANDTEKPGEPTSSCC